MTRILAVAEFFPWPSTGGGLMRMARIVRALAELGTVDLFALWDTRNPDPVVPPYVDLRRMASTPYPASLAGWRWRTTWAVGRAGPMEIVGRRADRSPRAAFESFVDESYDFVWFGTPAIFEWLGRPRLGPTVVDLDNLESAKEMVRARLLDEEARQTGHGGNGGMPRRLRCTVAATQARINARDWKVFERSVAGETERVVLCSDIDARRSGLPNVTVIPNTVDRGSPDVDRAEVGPQPAVLFQGTFNYAPNVDGARWLADEVAPRLRSLMPDARVRLVGKVSPVVERLDDPPGLTVVGSVPDMEPELLGAALAIVPLRYGSGTRIKIIESFAYRLPVVSTTLGAEGLDVEDGVHLLLADEPDAFAAACHRLLTDAGLRTRIVAAAEERYLERYQWSSVEGRFRALVSSVVASAASDQVTSRTSEAMDLDDEQAQRLAWIARVLANPPVVHPDAPNDSVWSTERSCYRFMADEVQIGSKTMETGAGVSTVLFAAWGCDHVTVVPFEDEVAAIAKYCDEGEIDRTRVEFDVRPSEVALPDRAESGSHLDLMFIDGSHGFPAAVIDWFYGAGRLRKGGVVVFDDVQLPQVGSFVRDVLDRDDRWQRIGGTSKWAAFRRLSEGSLGEGEWVQHYFPKPRKSVVERVKPLVPTAVKARVPWPRRSRP